MNYSTLPFLILLLFAGLAGCTNDSGSNKKPGALMLDSVTQKNNPFSPIDQSPMDMSYYPVDYPLLKMNGKAKEPLVARVIYSRPHKKGRQIFGNAAQSICQYGKPWRLGANEATEIEFFTDVFIGTTKIKAGRYIMYSIPYENKWTVILNDNIFSWGLNIDASRDIFKVDLPVEKTAVELEDFTMVFMPASFGTELVMAWDNVKVVLPVYLSQ
jgi:hypothetical protein